MSNMQFTKQLYNSDYVRGCFCSVHSVFKKELYCWMYGGALHTPTVLDAVDMYNMGNEI